MLLSGGSYYTLLLLSSNLFGMRILQGGLSTVQLQAFSSHKVWFNTLLENVPQVAVQLFFIIDFGMVTKVVIVSVLSSVCNIVLTVKSSLVSRATFQDLREFPFTLNVCWKPIGSETWSSDPYLHVGRRRALSNELFQLSGDSHPFNLEILASDKTATGAIIYGVVSMQDKARVDEQKEVIRFFQKTEQVKEAVIRAFRYRPLLAVYDFKVKVSASMPKQHCISDQVRDFLLKLASNESVWEHVKRMDLSEHVLHEIMLEINQLKADDAAAMECEQEMAEPQEFNGLLNSDDDHQV